MPAVKAKLKNLVQKKAAPKGKDNPWRLPAQNAFAALGMDVEDSDERSASASEHGSESSNKSSSEPPAVSTHPVDSPFLTHATVSRDDVDDSSHPWQTVRKPQRGGSDDSYKFGRPADVRNTDWNADKQKRRQSMHGVSTNETTLIIGNGKYANISRKYDHRIGPRTFDGIPFTDIRPGTMIFHYDVRPILGKEPVGDDRKLVFEVEKSKWLRKGRFWLVVSFHDDHIVEVPIYTYNDTGLERKPDRVKEYYNSVKAPWSTEFTNHSPNQKVLGIDSLRNQDESLRETMVVNVTEPVSHTVDADWNRRVVGRLSKESTEELLQRVKSFIGMTSIPDIEGSPRL